MNEQEKKEHVKSMINIFLDILGDKVMAYWLPSHHDSDQGRSQRQ